MWIIICPDCPYQGPIVDFSPSLCDECSCPECGCFFLFEPPDDEDECDDE